MPTSIFHEHAAVAAAVYRLRAESGDLRKRSTRLRDCSRLLRLRCREISRHILLLHDAGILRRSGVGGSDG